MRISCERLEACQDHWDKFVAVHPLGTVYHHSLWHRLISATYGIEPLYFLARGSGGEISSGMAVAPVRRGFNRIAVSYPFSDHCDPLLGPEEHPKEFISYILEYGLHRIELRLFRSPSVAQEPHERDYTNFVLNLDKGSLGIYKALNFDCIARRIRRAQKEGLCVTSGWDDSSLDDFYRMHASNRKRLGSPVQPRSFFQNLRDMLGNTGHATLLLAKKNGKAIASVITLSFKDTAYYKFGASYQEYSRTGANQLLLWHAIEMAVDSGFSYFDFGRTHRGHKGLMEYKARWGATQVPLTYSTSPSSVGFKEGGLASLAASAFFRTIPEAAHRLFSSVIYKYLA